MANALQQRRANLGGLLQAGNAQAFMDQIKTVVQTRLPQHLQANADTYLRMCATVLRKNERLRNASPQSIVAAVVEAAQVGLRSGVLGECYLVPYSGECQLIYGYQGLVDLARRGGAFIHVPVAVFEGEPFTYQPANLAQPILHEVDITAIPGDEVEAFGKMVAVYVLATVAGDPHPRVCVMNKAQVMAIGGSKMGGRYSGPWKTHPLQMALKCPVRRIAKFLPKSTEMARALESDGQTIRGFEADGEVDMVIEAELAEPVEEEPKEEKKNKKSKQV